MANAVMRVNYIYNVMNNNKYVKDMRFRIHEEYLIPLDLELFQFFR